MNDSHTCPGRALDVYLKTIGTVRSGRDKVVDKDSLTLLKLLT